LYCEKPSGPSRYAGDALQRSSDHDMDRSSPAQSSGVAPVQDVHNVDTWSGDSHEIH
jgi:hypothetical protein